MDLARESPDKDPGNPW